MKLVMGHTVLGVIMEFPHVCPGEDCAIGRWLAARATVTAFKTHTLPLPVERVTRRVTPPARPQPRRDGKTWPELIAEHL